jgi:pyridoxine 4-dehydrogenase
MTDQFMKPNAGNAGTIQLGDMTVNRFGFGTMRLPGPGVWGEPDDPDNARAVLRRAIDLGVNLIDTAEYYGPLVANRLVAEALYPYPSDLVIATKVGGKRGDNASWLAEVEPAKLKAACEANLKHLRLERIDLVHFRQFPRNTIPLADSLGALVDLQREGKIRHIGISSVTLAELAEAQHTATIVSVENLYNIAERKYEAEIDFCTEHKIVFMPYFPLATGKLSQAQGPLATVAQAHHATPSQIALAWLLARSPIMLPIPGTSSLEHLEENIAASKIILSTEEYSLLSDWVPAPAQFRSMG